MLEGVPIALIVAAIGSLGINGLVPIFWYVDHRRLDRQYLEHRVEILKAQAEHEKTLKSVLDKYKEDVQSVKTFYENNVDLVKNYEKLSEELMSVIRLTIQVQTQLVDNIKNNNFCPVMRGKGPDRG